MAYQPLDKNRSNFVLAGMHPRANQSKRANLIKFQGTKHTVGSRPCHFTEVGKLSDNSTTIWVNSSLPNSHTVGKFYTTFWPRVDFSYFTHLY